MSGEFITNEDRDNTQNHIEMAAIYFADGAFFTARDRLIEAMKVVEALCVARTEFLLTISGGHPSHEGGAA